MWTEYVENSFFVNELYVKVPELSDVIIENVDISYYGREIRVMLKIEERMDNIPLKWIQKGYNALIIEIDFYDVNEFDMRINRNTNCSISIKRNEDRNLDVVISGGIEASFFASAAFMQKASGYVK